MGVVRMWPLTGSGCDQKLGVDRKWVWLWLAWSGVGHWEDINRLYIEHMFVT